jgi:hypothetical protein
MDGLLSGSRGEIATGAFYEQAEAGTYPYQHGVPE